MVETAHVTQQGNHYSRRIVLLVTLDARNAFNSAKRADMVDTSERLFECQNTSTDNEKILYDTSGGHRRR